MQREENSNSCSKWTWGGVDFDKLFIILSVFLHIFLSSFLVLIYSSQMSPSAFLYSLWLLSCTSIFQHRRTPFSCLLVFFFFSSFATSLANVRCAVSCTIAANQVLHSSRVICVTENWKCAHAPLLCLHWQLHIHFIIDEQIRLERSQVTQCWINRSLLWVRI